MLIKEIPIIDKLAAQNATEVIYSFSSHKCLSDIRKNIVHETQFKYDRGFHANHIVGLHAILKKRNDKITARSEECQEWQQ